MEKAVEETYQSNLPRRQVMTALIGTLFTMFLGSIFITVTSTAMPRIVADMNIEPRNMVNNVPISAVMT